MIIPLGIIRHLHNVNYNETITGITETDDGFLCCVLYDRYGEVHAERKVELNVIGKSIDR